MRASIVLMFFLVLAFVPAALAADPVRKGEIAAEKSDNPPVFAAPDIDTYQDKTEDIYKILREISEGLSPPEERHFATIYNNYNLIGTVKMVQQDVGNAVDACSAANPDMESGIRGRFKTWNAAVGEATGEAEAHLGNMVAAQEYASPKKIKSLFKAIDKTRDLTNKEVKKQPVTSPEACTYLRDKMDETQKNLTGLLRETLMSVPAEVEEPPHPDPLPEGEGD